MPPGRCHRTWPSCSRLRPTLRPPRTSGADSRRNTGPDTGMWDSSRGTRPPESSRPAHSPGTGEPVEGTGQEGPPQRLAKSPDGKHVTAGKRKEVFDWLDTRITFHTLFRTVTMDFNFQIPWDLVFGDNFFRFVYIVSNFRTIHFTSSAGIIQ